MPITEISSEDRDRWDQFIKENSSSFLQSFGWGIFQESLRRKIWRLVVVDINVAGIFPPLVDPPEAEIPESQGINSLPQKVKQPPLLVIALVVKHNLPLSKTYLYCPRGPILKNSKLKIQKSKILKILLDKIKEIAKRENSIFLRIDPAIQQPTTNLPPLKATADPPKVDNQQLTTLLKELGFLKTSKEVQPKDTLVLNITEPEGELLAKMHHKARYNIRLAKRKGIKIKQSTNIKDVDIFWDLLCETVKREKFKPHPKEYYKKQIEVLGKENLLKLFLAEYKNKTIAANINSFFGNKAFYLHGASLYQYRNLMAPHLLQWEAILEAKKRGCKEYDFWGIAGKNKKSKTKNQKFMHPWAGLTRFKKGFGGKEAHYIGTWDLVYQPFWYKVYNLTKLKIK